MTKQETEALGGGEGQGQVSGKPRSKQRSCARVLTTLLNVPWGGAPASPTCPHRGPGDTGEVEDFLSQAHPRQGLLFRFAGPSHGTLPYQGSGRGWPGDPWGQMVTQDGSKLGEENGGEQAGGKRTNAPSPTARDLGPALCCTRIISCYPHHHAGGMGLVPPLYRRGNGG